MKPYILVVEDNEKLGYVLKTYLEIKGMKICWTQNGVDALRLFQEEAFDLCILDIMMPGIDGFDLAKRMKEIQYDIPLIFLTSRTMKIDKLKGFNLGADDYIVKPVDEEELEARIKAVLRRATSDTIHQHSYNLGTYVFYPDKAELSIGEKVQRLTERESAVLSILCQNINQLTTRTQILKSIWGKNDYFSRKSMDVFIFRIRKYLDADEQVKILNVHGRGYILEVPGER